MPTFSIIIPHHEIPELLQRCLDSIPDTPEVQVIVVDDNSSEDKVDFTHFPGLCRKYTECIFDRDGGGAGHARNVGLKHATGKWLVFADADDYFVDGAFDVFNIHCNDQEDVIQFKADSVDSNDFTPSFRHMKINNAIDKSLSGVISAKEAILTEPAPWSKMFCREHIMLRHILFDEIYASNDAMFVVKATCWAEDNRVTTHGDVVYTVTTRKNSLHSNKKVCGRNYLSNLDMVIRRNKFFEDYPYEKRPVIVLVIRALKIGPKTFWKAFLMAVKYHALFSGSNVILKKLFGK